MNYFDPYPCLPDQTTISAWDCQVAEIARTPRLTEVFAKSGNEIFPRFAACYAELRALPRSARRALQRRIARSAELAAILPEYLRQGGRRLQRRMAWSLAGAALLLALGQGVATAATITVTTSDPSIIADGQCSLIEAIVNANNDAATHADCAAGSGTDTIVLPANANVTLSAVDNSSLGPTGLPVITSRITIEGNGATIARQGNAPAFGLMAESSSGDLTLQNVTLSGGSSSGRGGGVNNFEGTLTIEDSTISGNTGVWGGGVFNRGILTIENSTISGNTAVFGGGVFNDFATLTIENSTISGNTANYGGGGVENLYGTLTIENSTISGNTANYGGGVSNFVGTPTIQNSTLSGNSADVGGGVFNSPGYFGGGSLTVTNSTISGNIANEAGGLFNTYYCYYYCNFGTLTLNNSLIAGNQAAVAPEIENSYSIVYANNFNLFGANGDAGVTGFAPGPTDIVPAAGVQLADILGPLADNGGPTDTHALVAGSPAIDAGDPGGCRETFGELLLTDQRGFARPVDGNNDGTVRCDIGATEYGAEFVPVPTPTLTVSKAGIGSGTVTSNPAGIDCGGDCSENYNGNTVVTLTPTADAASVFLGWSGHPDCADGVVTMNANKTCTATFTRPLTLTVSKAGTGSGTVTSNPAGIDCGGDCSENYNAATVVTLTANPDAISVFSGWSGDPDCSDGVVTMNADKNCTATFTKRLNVTAANGGEVWQRGSRQTILWTSIGVNGRVRIQLSRDGGSTWKNLFLGAANDGFQNWRVTKPATTQARIRVCSVQSPSICDTSDADFTIQ